MVENRVKWKIYLFSCILCKGEIYNKNKRYIIKIELKKPKYGSKIWEWKVDIRSKYNWKTVTIVNIKEWWSPEWSENGWHEEEYMKTTSVWFIKWLDLGTKGKKKKKRFKDEYQLCPSGNRRIVKAEKVKLGKVTWKCCCWVSVLG